MRTLLITSGKFRAVDDGTCDPFNCQKTATFDQLTMPLTGKFSRFILQREDIFGDVTPTFYSTRLGVLSFGTEAVNYPATNPSHDPHKDKRSEVAAHQELLKTSSIPWDSYNDDLQISGSIYDVILSALNSQNTRLVIAMQTPRMKLCEPQIKKAVSIASAKYGIDTIIKRLRIIGKDVEGMFGILYRVCVPNVSQVNPNKLAKGGVSYSDLYNNVMYYLYATKDMPFLDPDDEYKLLRSKAGDSHTIEAAEKIADDFNNFYYSTKNVSPQAMRDWIAKHFDGTCYGSVSRAVMALRSDETELGEMARSMSMPELTDWVESVTS